MIPLLLRAVSGEFQQIKIWELHFHHHCYRCVKMMFLYRLLKLAIFYVTQNTVPLCIKLIGAYLRTYNLVA